MTVSTDDQIKHAWSVLCRGSSTDQDTKTISLFNCIERINLDQEQITASQAKHGQDYIIIPFGFELVTLWWREQVDSQISTTLKIGLLDPGEKVLFSKEYPLLFAVGKRRVRIRAKMNDLKIGPAGTYRFRLYLKQPQQNRFQVAAEVPLEVVLVDLQSAKQ